MADAQNNARPIVNAATVTPETPLPWTVIIQVLQKTTVKLSSHGKRYQNYVFTDMEGTLIGVVCYEHHIAPLSRLLRPYQRYYVSNANVKGARADYRVGDYVYGWTLTLMTPVELIHDAVPLSIPCDFNFQRFSQLHRLIDHAEPIAVRGLIIHSYVIGDPAQASPTRDYIIVDDEKKPMIIRVWGDMLDNDMNQVSAIFPRPTMVVLLNVKVTTYHGLSLGTKNNTFAFHNPPLPVTTSLLEWYNENTDAVIDMIHNETYKDTDVLLPPPSLDELVPISEVADVIDVMKAVWVRGTVQLIQGQERLWYKACQQCHKAIRDNITWEFPCNSCGLTAPGEPRCHVGVYLSENGSALRATLFSPDAEKLILYMPGDLKAADEKNVSHVREIDLATRNKEVFCFLKSRDTIFQGNNVRTYPVLKMYLKSEVDRADGKNTTVLNISEVGSTSTAEGPAGDESKLFLTPSLKNSLDDIEVEPAKLAPNMQSNAVKRPLNFGQPGDHSCPATSGINNTHADQNRHDVGDANVVAEELGQTTRAAIHVNLPGNEAGSTIESPVKKTRSKED